MNGPNNAELARILRDEPEMMELVDLVDIGSGAGARCEECDGPLAIDDATICEDCSEE